MLAVVRLPELLQDCRPFYLYDEEFGQGLDWCGIGS